MSSQYVVHAYTKDFSDRPTAVILVLTTNSPTTSKL